MITTLAVSNYRSLRDLVIPFGPLNVITGENASGKSNLYKALRLLSDTAQGGVIRSLASEGGLSSTFWAGPEKITREMRDGSVPVQGGPRSKRARLRLGFSGDDFGYAVSLGLPIPGGLGPTAFSLDPEIKRECIWAGSVYRPASALVDRDRAIVKVRDRRSWQVIAKDTSHFDSIFAQPVDPETAPEIVTLRDDIKSWRFYDHFRTDTDAPARRKRYSEWCCPSFLDFQGKQESGESASSFATSSPARKS